MRATACTRLAICSERLLRTLRAHRCRCEAPARDTQAAPLLRCRSQQSGDTLKILHVTPTYLPATRYGGPIFSVHGLAKALAASGNDVTVFTTSVDGDSDSAVPHFIPTLLDGVRIRYFRSPLLRRLYWSPAMRTELSRCTGAFDVVHLHSVFLWPTAAAARAARRSDVPYVISPRGMLVRELIDAKSRIIKSGWIRLIERRNLAHAAAVHFTSRLEQQQAAALGLPLPHPAVIPNGVDVPAEVSHAPRETDLLLFLGRVDEKKGLDRLIRALRSVPRARLMIAGNDERNLRPQFERLAGETGVLDRVVFTGPVRDSEKHALLARATALVLPSYSENFGNVVLEAMAAGCPAIVTREVGAGEIIASRGGGIVCDGDPDALAAAIGRLLAAPSEERERLGRQARDVASEYSWTVIAEEMQALYDSMQSRVRTC